MIISRSSVLTVVHIKLHLYIIYSMTQKLVLYVHTTGLKFCNTTIYMVCTVDVQCPD